MSLSNRNQIRRRSANLECRRGNNAFWILSALAMLAAIFIAGWWYVNRPVSTDNAEQEAIRFLDLIREGEVDLAWEGTTAEFKSFVGLDRLKTTVQQNSALRQPSEIFSSQKVNVGPLELLECLFAPENNPDIQIRVLLAPTKKREWKVERLELEDS